MAPLLAAIGLAVAAVLTFSLFGVGLLSPRRANGGGAVAGGPVHTPNPSVVFTPPPPQGERGVEVRGSILFVNAGNIWSASGRQLRQLSGTGRDSAPVWAPDGQSIYFVETRSRSASVPYQGTDSRYLLDYPLVMRMRPDGSGRTVVKDSLFQLTGRNKVQYYFTWLVQPDISPDGRTLALVTDAPDPLRQEVTMSLMPATGGTIRQLNLPQDGLGHNDPAWSPDGKQIAFTYNARNGAIGTPRIALYDVARNRMRLLSPPGYARPSWSPDGRFLVVERSTGRTRDLTVLRSSDGEEVGRLTYDGRSFAPTWSPDGTQIAYLRVDEQAIDLHLLTLTVGDPNGSTGDQAVTSGNDLEGASPPSWSWPERPRVQPEPGESGPGRGSIDGGAIAARAPVARRP